MIATRRRRKRVNLKPWINLFMFCAAVYEVHSVPMLHKAVFDGPLKPFWLQMDALNQHSIKPVVDPFLIPLTKPLHFVVQQHDLLERAHKISLLQGQLSSESKQIASIQHEASGLKKKIAALTQAQQNPQTAATPSVSITPSPGEVTTAGYWASMEAENAASITQKLDPHETARIFTAMKPDQVAEIMNALPADYNVRLKKVM